MPSTIKLLDFGNAVAKEGQADRALRPGHLVEHAVTASGNEFIRPHSSAASVTAQPEFAREAEVFGKDYLSPYASGDRVFTDVYHQGHRVYALIKEGSAALVHMDALESAGDGTLKKRTTGKVLGHLVQKGGLDPSGSAVPVFGIVEIA